MFFATSQTSNLAAFNFTGHPSGATQFSVGSGYEIVPVPEASTVFGVLALLGLVGYRERRHFMRMRAAV